MSTRREWLLWKFVFLTALKSVVYATDCCSPGNYLTETKLCNDSQPFNLKCEDGAFLIDPNASEYDTFFVNAEGLLVIQEREVKPDGFCLGRIKRNESEISENLVALVCFENFSGNQITITVYSILMLVSIFFLIITLYVYMVLPNLRDLQGKCVIAFISCLISSYIILLVVQTFPESSQATCVVQAAFLYFFLSATFFWNNIITFNIWKAIRNSFTKVEERTWCFIYIAWGFGAPLLMVLLSFVMQHIPGETHIRPNFGEIRCWFKGNVENWSYFYGPISVLLLLNTLMFLHCSWSLWKSYRGLNVSRIRSLKFKYGMYLKLFLLMGTTWIFEVISFAMSYNESTKYLWFVTDFFNSAQGVIIFLILVIFRKKVRKELVNKKLCNIKWPESWAKGDIQESSTIFSADEVELANHKTKIFTEPH